MTLHITNGDSAAYGLRRSSVVRDGDIVLPWRDVLHDGPVVDDDGPAAFRGRRAAFLAARSTTSATQIFRDFTERDAQLEAHVHASHDIVLWFEPDLYDQLQLIQVLTHCAMYARHDFVALRPTLSIVPADVMLGTLEPSDFAPLHEARRLLSFEDFGRAQDAWRAFSASTPVALERMVDDAITPHVMQALTATYATDTRSQLPFLTAALHRLLQEYPSMSTGLSWSEDEIVQALKGGPMTIGALFPAAHHAHEEWPWLGDTSFAWYVERLSDVPRPLVVFADGSPVRAAAPGADFWQRTVMLTDFGRVVADAGGIDEDVPDQTADVIAANGIDRWIGGVHLTTANHWRNTGSELVHLA